MGGAEVLSCLTHTEWLCSLSQGNREPGPADQSCHSDQDSKIPGQEWETEPDIMFSNRPEGPEDEGGVHMLAGCITDIDFPQKGHLLLHPSGLLPVPSATLHLLAFPCKPPSEIPYPGGEQKWNKASQEALRTTLSSIPSYLAAWKLNCNWGHSSHGNSASFREGAGSREGSSLGKIGMDSERLLLIWSKLLLFS